MSEHESDSPSDPPVTPPYGSDEWIAMCNAEIVEQKKLCLFCTEPGTMYLERRLISKPIGTFSLAGEQMKTSVVEALICTCSKCGMAARVSQDG